MSKKKVSTLCLARKRLFLFPTFKAFQTHLKGKETLLFPQVKVQRGRQWQLPGYLKLETRSVITGAESSCVQLYRVCVILVTVPAVPNIKIHRGFSVNKLYLYNSAPLFEGDGHRSPQLQKTYIFTDPVVLVKISA